MSGDHVGVEVVLDSRSFTKNMEVLNFSCGIQGSGGILGCYEI